MAKKKKNEQPAEPKPELRQLPELPKERNPLLALLTVLLVLVGVSELAVWGWFGFSAFQSSRAQRQYEAEQRAAAEERAAQGIVSGSAYGPRLKVENGQVTWRLEDEDQLPAGGGTSSGAAVSQGGGAQAGQSQSRIYIPKIPYALAEQKTEGQPASQGAQSLGGGDTTPA